MTRRKVKWWAYLFADTARFIKSAEGKIVLELLTEWWIEAENIYQADQIPSTGKGLGPKPPWDRYTDVKFYRRLKAEDFPSLKDSDEVALDRVFTAFATWTMTRKARKLADKSIGQVRSAIEKGLQERVELTIDSDLAASLSSTIDSAVHHAVHHSVHQSVHSAVHSSVHHAVTDGGHGGAHGGSGGGHH